MSEWRVYGCGSASSNRYLQSSYEWIEGDFRLTFDFGYGALYRRCLAEGDITNAMDHITHLFLSHGHPDHIVELSRLAIALKHTPGYSPNQKIQLLASPETLQSVEELLQHTGPKEAFLDFFVPYPVKTGDLLERNQHLLQIIPAHHREGSVGLRLQSPSGLRIAYTGDTGQFSGQEESLYSLDLLVIEASFLYPHTDIHMTVEQVAELMGAVSPRGVLIVHPYPEVENRPDVEIRGIFSKWYPGNVFIARDGMKLAWDVEQRDWRETRFLEEDLFQY